MKTARNVNTAARRAKQWRFNPLTNLQPATLARHLDAFEAGHLRDAVGVWEALEQRDDLLRTVISKRKKSVARHGWTVLPVSGLTDVQRARAGEHAQALEYFYNHLECEHAVDTAEKGGFKLLARQMMDAVGKRFAVHEIIWRGAESTDQSTSVANGTNRHFASAKFRFVPLAFFENTTGRLRFLEQDFAQEGRELEPGGWMITVGDGLMMASSTAWMFKHLSLDDWLHYSQRNGTPALKGISAAARDSVEWQALEQALADMLDGNSVVHSTTDEIEPVNLTAGGAIPFPELVERIDRMLAALWRGADLSTISRDRGYGASLQEKEVCALEEDDAEMLSETLNRYVDEWVIRHVFGAGEKPLARVKVLVSPRECTTADLQIDEFLLRHGAPISVQETLSRYGRALPKPGEKIFTQSTIANRDAQASRPASLQKAGMHNEGFVEEVRGGLPNDYETGPSVSFRGGSPGADSIGADGDSPQAVALDPVTESPARAGLENQFTILQEEWLQLAPFGDFPHARGLQRVDRDAAAAMVAQFHSFRGRVGRLFGGVPVYVGHPDLPGTTEYRDRKAYGWIMELEQREDGLYGRVKWSEAGLDLLRNAHFKFYSPYWEAREAGAEAGRRVYRPVALISVGLTNQPNIPVRPLANEGSRCCRNEIAGDEVTSLPPSDPTNLPALSNVELPPLAHTVSCTEGLGLRKAELVRLPNRRDRIQECVLGKMRLGLSYDEAWEHVKREHAGWFRD